MDKKNTQVPTTTVTRDLRDFGEDTGNLYESIVVMSKRANQVAQEQKQELEDRLQEFSTYADPSDDMVENEEQVELSKYYERLPKPSLISAHEFENGEIYYRRANEEKADNDNGKL
ncbi:MAG: DNA-directed RNA polymerase subunit omega [Porphyromonas sp.]|nr:DNA-directed RNA polymerase subunit omega [Porphyromonas sp.]